MTDVSAYKRIRKLADYVPWSEKRKLPPPGVEEVWRGRTQKPTPYEDFKKKWEFRQPPEFRGGEPNWELYQDYLRWFKTKGRPERYSRYYV